MGLSARTKSTIASALVLNQNETYPDREFLTASENAIKEDTTSGTLRIDKNIVPRTSDDMSKLYKWKKGDKLYGTHATREEVGMNLYIKDINNAPDPSDYKPIYIDSFRPIVPQMDKFKK